MPKVPSRNLIASKWDQFDALVMPPGAPDRQRQEMKKAFYAGAEAMFRIQYGIGDPGVTEDEGCAVLDSITTEMLEFAERLGKTGRA